MSSSSDDEDMPGSSKRPSPQSVLPSAKRHCRVYVLYARIWAATQTSRPPDLLLLHLHCWNCAPSVTGCPVVATAASGGHICPLLRAFELTDSCGCRRPLPKGQIIKVRMHNFMVRVTQGSLGLHDCPGKPGVAQRLAMDRASVSSCHCQSISDAGPCVYADLHRRSH